MGAFRHPKTTNERRQSQTSGNFLEYDEYKIRIRPKRNHKNLPDVYDDILSSWTCNWKKYRKTQYRS